jgi:plastocyanin
MFANPRTTRVRPSLLALALAGALTAAPATTAGAQTPAAYQIVSPSQAQLVGPAAYVSPVHVIPQGTSITYTNVDLPLHDVIARQNGPDGKPLFASRLVSLGQSAPVLGVEALPPGSYPFTCSLHNGMNATLEVVAAPGAPGGGGGGEEPPPSGDGTTYSAPYAEGPTSGDSWTRGATDAESGRITVGRAYPVPGVISCTGGNAQRKFQIEHQLTRPLREVTVDFAEAAVDNYAWITVAVKDADGEWLAKTSLRGPVVDSGSLTAPIFDNLPEDLVPEVGETVTIQFGIELASACANAQAGSARFTEVTVR